MTLRRYINNPILTREDIPSLPPEISDVTSVFNPGAVYHAGRFKLLLRVQTRGRRTHLLMAEGKDWARFEVSEKPVELRGLEKVSQEIFHVYDPRITRIDDTYFIMVAMDTTDGCRLGVVQTDDFENFAFLGITESEDPAAGTGSGAGARQLASSKDVRNGVLFPERFDGKYLRLERPNLIKLTGGPTTGRQIVLAESTDLMRWRPVATVMSGRNHYWDELIGSGPPPVKTRAGWLHIYHGIATHFGSTNIYQAGAVLLDLADPSQVMARTRDNVLEPRLPYELVGQVPNVVFPSGLIVEHDDEGYALPDSKIYLYYGAADTCVGLAICRTRELIAACRG
jgi:beta-1,4-mannooligosaccharide/beta-1,4-mannosyl-N-acetylglucosamine phosphorylase